MNLTPDDVALCGVAGAGVSALLEQIRAEIAAGQLFGMQVYVSRAQRVLANVALGWSRDSVPMLPTTVTHWLCCGKPLTALALARLMEAERVDVDQPVMKYLPEFACKQKQSITVSELLCHTSGLVGDPALEAMFCPWTTMVDAACGGEREPGWDATRRARYVDFSSWIILGEIVRRATGLGLGASLRQAFFSELGMVDSHLGMSTEAYDAYGARLSLLHVASRPRPRECAFLNWRSVADFEWPAFGARGPGFELGRWYEALLGFGPRVVDPALLDRFTGKARLGIHDEAWGDDTSWGLGFIPDERFWGLQGLGVRVYGHTGMGSSFSLAVPAWGLVVVCIGNTVALPKVHRQRIVRFMGLLVNGLRAAGELP